MFSCRLLFCSDLLQLSSPRTLVWHTEFFPRQILMTPSSTNTARALTLFYLSSLSSPCGLHYLSFLTTTWCFTTLPVRRSTRTAEAWVDIKVTAKSDAVTWGGVIVERVERVGQIASQTLISTAGQPLCHWLLLSPARRRKKCRDEGSCARLGMHTQADNVCASCNWGDTYECGSVYVGSHVCLPHRLC